MTNGQAWTFKRYLEARRDTDSVQGNFTKDALRDPHFPDTTKWQTVKAYMLNRRADPDTIRIASSVFQQYLRGARLRRFA